MPRLVRLETWRQRVFDPDDMPAYNTALRWAKNGRIPGAVHVGGGWHVDLARFEAALENAATDEADEGPSFGSELADRLAQAGKKAG